MRCARSLVNNRIKYTGWCAGIEIDIRTPHLYDMTSGADGADIARVLALTRGGWFSGQCIDTFAAWIITTQKHVDGRLMGDKMAEQAYQTKFSSPFEINLDLPHAESIYHLANTCTYFETECKLTMYLKTARVHSAAYRVCACVRAHMRALPRHEGLSIDRLASVARARRGR